MKCAGPDGSVGCNTEQELGPGVQVGWNEEELGVAAHRAVACADVES
jgi:hypothetical protein